ncbi:nucleoside deaminase [Maribellus sediminis]|uniref:nucleoside deaminase n=1 Tax=Maribellus sediminis TaxID=2696285 RepID=UPI00197F2201|nr:nucleoside deaminase [Maribellus sediminis]
MKEADGNFMRAAIRLAEKGMQMNAGGPFGAVVVKDGEIIAEGFNRVTSDNDPTAHAEVIAIREACKKLGTFQLDDCVIYTSCEPCPMCLGAIYWARPKKVFYACTREDAALAAFDDQFIYDELKVNIQERKVDFENIIRDEGLHLFSQWKAKSDKMEY